MYLIVCAYFQSVNESENAFFCSINQCFSSDIECVEIDMPNNFGNFMNVGTSMTKRSKINILLANMNEHCHRYFPSAFPASLINTAVSGMQQSYFQDPS